MAMMMKNNGEIVANELDEIRYERLKYNLEKQGVTIANVLNSRGETIGKRYPEYFNKVLLDAPCSGEGRFIGTIPATYRDWSTRNVSSLSKLQKKLFKSAYDSLKPGGEMVYSTCTLNLEEDEEVLEYALENFNIKILEINLDIKSKIKAKSGDQDIMNYLNGKIYKNDISKAIRIIPSKLTEGFFVAKIKKL